MGGLRVAAVLRACAAAAVISAACGAAAQDATTFQAARVGMERATKTPLEIVWLREEVLVRLWRDHPALAERSRACSAVGAPKAGCTLGERPAQRYHLGAGSLAERGFAPLGQGVLVVAPGAGPSGLLRAPGGQLILAAGAAVQLIDAAYPEIRVEIRAPRDQPLPLGNLVSADIGKAVALLARQPGVTGASIASVGAAGRVAFNATEKARTEKVMMAAVAPLPPPAAHVDFDDQRGKVAIAANGEGSGGESVLHLPPAPVRETVVLASIHPDLDIEYGARVAVNSNGEGNGRDAVLYAPAEVVSAEKVMIASVAPPQVLQAFDFEDQGGKVAIATNGEGTGLDAVAHLVPAPAKEAAPLPAVARLRAEVETEIARDRARIAAAMQASCAKAGAYRTGCTVNPPRRVVFAGV